MPEYERNLPIAVREPLIAPIGEIAAAALSLYDELSAMAVRLCQEGCEP